MPTEKTEQHISNLKKKNSQQPLTPYVAEPDYATRFSGVLLTFVSSIGLLLTSPLLFLGGIIGLITSIFSGADPFESGLNGAKIGSLGTINGISWGIELAQATLTVKDIDQQAHSLFETDSDELELAPSETSVEQATIKLKSTTSEVTNEQETITEPDITLVEQETVNEMPITPEKPGSEQLDTTMAQETAVEPLKKEPSLEMPKVEPTVQSQDNAETTPIIKASSLSAAFFPKTKDQPSINTPLETPKIDISERFKDLITKVKTLIAQAEAQLPEQQQERNLLTITEQNAIDLAASIKSSSLSAPQFWHELDQMSQADVTLWVSQFNSTQEKGKHSLSELDHLWLYFKGVEIETSKEEDKKNKFATVLRALSEKQLQASFNSASFLSVLTNNAYIAAAANSLNSEQLALFASNNMRHEMLDGMIKKLRPSPFLFGKLFSIIPYSSALVETSLIKQIDHLNNETFPVTFKKELRALVQQYILSNKEEEKKRLEALQATLITKTQSLPSLPTKKWATVNASTKPIYAKTTILQKPDWSGEEFNEFVLSLNGTDYYLHKEELQQKLAYLPDNRVIMLVKRATTANGKNLLSHLWELESKTINQLSELNSQEARLKIVLEHLSESQLASSVAGDKFWEIFRNLQGPCCKMAANTLTPQQFATIIANADSKRHEDLIMILSQITADSPTEKTRQQMIMDEIVPHASPQLIYALKNDVRTAPAFNVALVKYEDERKKQLAEESSSSLRC